MESLDIRKQRELFLSSYTAYVDYLQNKGWNRENIIINENDELSTIYNISKKNITRSIFIDIKCPINQKITIMGEKQIPKDPDFIHGFGLYITDENENEIPDNTKIRINKETPDHLAHLERIFYKDCKIAQKTNILNINDFKLYRFANMVELNGARFRVSTTNCECNIPKENIKFTLNADLWTHNNFNNE